MGNKPKTTVGKPANKKTYQLPVRFIDGTDEVLFRVMKKLGKDGSQVIRWALLNFDREIQYRKLDHNGLLEDPTVDIVRQHLSSR